MALNSPGVQVSVVDESFYLPASPSTVPMIFVASAANKQNASGTGLAAGTDPANAGKVWLITSQRDLTDTFGTPVFYTDANGNPVNGGELNEYGLQAAYSLLGASSRAYIARADVDLSQLLPLSSAPDGSPVDGTYWLDTSNTAFGVFEWNKTSATFTNKVASVINNDNVANVTTDGATPKSSFGANGTYAVVATSDNDIVVWYKNKSGNWVIVGSNQETGFTATSTFASTCWQTSFPVVTATRANPNLTSYNGQAILINTQTVTLSGTTITALATSINTIGRTHGFGARVNANGYLELYADASAKSNGSTADGKLAIADDSGGAPMLAAIGLTVATHQALTLFQGPHTKYPDYTAVPTGSVYVKTTSPNTGAKWSTKVYSAGSQTWTTVDAPIYTDRQTAINTISATGNVAVGKLFVEQNTGHGTGATILNPQLGQFKVWRRNASSPTSVKSVTTIGITSTSTTSTFQIKEGLATSTNGVADYSSYVTVTLAPGSGLDEVIAGIQNAGLTHVSADAATYDADGNATSMVVTHAIGGEIRFNDGTGTPLATLLGFETWARDEEGVETGTKNLYARGAYDIDGADFIASNWKPLVFEAKDNAPFTSPADGALWYSSVVDEVDIMVHDGSTWVGYLNQYPQTDPAGPIVSATEPLTQSGGDPLVDNDIWVSTADIGMYGQEIYVRTNGKWVAQDVADQTTPTGWLFADARWAESGSTTEPTAITTLLESDYLDPDAPDPALYPRGMRLWNLRRSGFNVKKYVVGHINVNANDGQNTRYNDEDMASYVADRWITVSPNDAAGVGAFGAHAQRGFVVAGLKELIDTNESIRDTDTVVFNLIAAPGYPEAIQNMVAFNVDRGQTAFVVGDTPFTLAASGTSLSDWGNNINGALDNNADGAVSYDEYMAMFYPSGYTNDNTGNYIVVPPSHMMLRTIAMNDQKSYEWFAPAGTRRGGVDNATAVGYIKDGEFVRAALPESIRDVMASVKVNPIATLPGAGIVNFGQYTRARNASSLDRINVARLVCYLRRQLSLLVKPFLFEPNDKITRNEIKAAADSFMLELVGKRAIYDFITVCDESNNTPTRVDRSELWLDIAIEPVKAVEFIYIPLRLKNTGAIQAGL
jgi:hypothetical protein